MKNYRPISEAVIIGTLLLFSSVPGLRAQSYSIDWYKIAAGGASTGGSYQVAGLIGQPAAGSQMSGGSFTLTSGFWSLISVVSTPGAPSLIVFGQGPNSVKILWPNTGNYTLQQNHDLGASTGWAKSGFTITTANGTNSITITPPAGNLFFRLSNP
jgi:hypothetical protein